MKDKQQAAACFFICVRSGGARRNRSWKRSGWREKRDISAVWQCKKLFEKSLQKPLDITKIKWYIVITLKKG